MDRENIMPWIRSFEGVTEENCPDFQSLRDGIVLSIITNHIQTTEIDISTLSKMSKPDDWITCLKNLKILQKVLEPALKAIKQSAIFELMAIARNQNENALNQLVTSLIVLALKGPKKAEQLPIIKKQPPETQKAIKAALGSLVSKSPAKPAAPPPDVKSAEQILLEKQIKQLEEEQSNLKDQHESLLQQKKATQPDLPESQDSIELTNAEKEKAKIEALSQELDAEIKKRENVPQLKRTYQAELDSYLNRIKELEAQVKDGAPSIDDFRNSEDPEVQQAIKDIDEARKILDPQYANKLREDNNSFKKAITQLNNQVKELREIVGEPTESNETGALPTKIDDSTNRSNQMNEEIMELMVKSNAIERLKQPQSFLEHLRSSTLFLKPE